MNPIMVDGKIEKLDEVQTVKHEGEIKIKITEKELQYRFDLYIRSVCAPFAPADSSGRIKTALYKFFEDVLKMTDYTKIQEIILGHENNQVITDYVNKAKEEYSLKIVEELTEQRETEHVVWNVPETIDYTSRYKPVDYKKSIMRPNYEKPGSGPEQEFVDLLEDSKNKVVWWFKNGESEKKYFAVKYKDKYGVERAFYVDFIVMTENGKIGLFDTKSGRTAEDAKEKAEALSEYLEKYSKKLWGGIVVFKEGSCRYNNKKKYVYTEGVLGDDWDFLSFK
jgi:type III restriction enzyme